MRMGRPTRRFEIAGMGTLAEAAPGARTADAVTDGRNGSFPEYIHRFAIEAKVISMAAPAIADMAAMSAMVPPA